MKIVLAGASGSGKTTLAKALSQELGLKFVEQSAGLIMLPEDKKNLKEWHGYNGNAGQRGVINKSHDEESSFGLSFQQAVLRARKHVLNEMDGESFILDRSPLDPAVFYMNQVVHNYHQAMAEDFFKECFNAFIESGITHILKINLNYGTEIENNGSRVHNWYFQKKIDLLFDFVIDRFLKYVNEYSLGYQVEVAVIPMWDWDKRLQGAKDFINRVGR